jgi:hypothetical protein
MGADLMRTVRLAGEGFADYSCRTPRLIATGRHDMGQFTPFATASPRNRKLFLAALAVLALAFGIARHAAAEQQPAPVAIADFSFVDTSGEVRDQSADHRAWLDMFTKLLREEIEKTGKFAIVELQCGPADCPVQDGIATEPLVAAARQAGARYLVVGGIQKMSTLVQWARLGMLDLESRKAVVDRLYTFRGDTQDAWRHAALYVARTVNEAPTAK